MKTDLTWKESGIAAETKNEVGTIGGLKRFTMIGYGAGTVIGDFVWVIFNTFFLFFMTGQLGISPAVGGTILAVSTLVSAFTIPMMGIFSDTRTWQQGRRGPFILWGGGGTCSDFYSIFREC